jgi:hypothetical protein
VHESLHCEEGLFQPPRSSPSHDGNVTFAKALLDLSRANEFDKELIHPVISHEQDFSVGQAIQELSKAKEIVAPWILFATLGGCSKMTRPIIHSRPLTPIRSVTDI